MQKERVEFYLHAPVVRYHLLRYKIQSVEQFITFWIRKIPTDRHTLAQVKEALPRTGHESLQKGEGTGIALLFL
jgi:hypothetical protein